MGLEHARIGVFVVLACGSCTACGPSAPTGDAGSDAPSAPDDSGSPPSDTGIDGAERPDAASVELVLGPARVDFELAGPGCTRSSELTLSNEGTAPSGPLSFEIGGLHASEFAVASHECADGLAPGARCGIVVELRPTTVGSFEASLTVDASGSGATAELRGASVHDGCGWPPVASPRFLEFGTLIVGTTSTPQTVVVTNRGGGSLGPLGVELTGPYAGSFSLTRDLCSGASLTGGASCELDVVMSPSSPGALVASLDVSTPEGATASVSLSGTGSSGVDAWFEPATADFGAWSVGASSSAMTFTVRNPGTDPTGVATVTIVGASPGDFAIDASTSTCPDVPLPGGSSCVVVVSFSPTMVGARSAVLRFTAAPGGTLSAALTGTGT